MPREPSAAPAAAAATVTEMTTTDCKVSIDKMKPERFLDWTFRVHRLALSKGLATALVSTGDASKDARAFDLIIHHLDDKDLRLARTCTTGKQLWDKLHSQYANNSQAAQLNMKQELFHMKQIKNESAQEWGNRISEQFYKHQTAGLDTSEGEACQMLLKGVLPPFHTVRDTILVTCQTLELDKIITSLISYEQMILNNKSSSYDSSQDSAYLVSSNNRRFDTRPLRRPTPAARFENSSRPPQQTRPPQQPRGPQRQTTRPPQQSQIQRPQRRRQGNNQTRARPLGNCYNCGKPGHRAAQCEEDPNDNGQRQSYYTSLAFTVSADNNISRLPGEKNYVIDSGSTHHVASDISMLHNVRDPPPSGRYVTYANGIRGKVIAIGDSLVTTPEWPEGFTLRNVLVVEGVSENLLSTRAVTRAGGTVTLTNDGCEISARGTVVAYVPYGPNGSGLARLYPLNMASADDDSSGEPTQLIKPTPSEVNTVTLETQDLRAAYNILSSLKESPQLWHERLGHLGYKNFYRVVNEGMVEGINITAAEVKAYADLKEPCGPCAEGKSTRQPFRRSKSRAAAPLLLLHTTCLPCQSSLWVGVATCSSSSTTTPATPWSSP